MRGGDILENNNIEKLLKALLDETKLLTVQTKAEAIRKFNADFLTSDLRHQMYESFDGVRTLQQISTDIKYSLQGTTQGNGLTGADMPVRFSM